MVYAEGERLGEFTERWNNGGTVEGVQAGLGEDCVVEECDI